MKHPWGRAQLREGIHRWHRAEGEEDPRGRRAKRGQVGTEAAGEMQAGKAEECRAHVLREGHPLEHSCPGYGPVRQPLATRGSGVLETWLVVIEFWILFQCEHKWPQWLAATLRTGQGGAWGKMVL